MEKKRVLPIQPFYDVYDSAVCPLLSYCHLVAENFGMVFDYVQILQTD